MQIQVGDWVKVGGKWQLVKSLGFIATETGVLVDEINDYKGGLCWGSKDFDGTNHRSVDGPFKVGDEIEHKTYGKHLVAGFDTHGYIISKSLNWAIMPENCKLVKPVEAFEQEQPKEKSFEESVAESFQKGLESYKYSRILEKAKTLIEKTIAPKTYMGTPEWTALTTVWTILLEVTNDPNIRLIHGKVKDYITIPIAPRKEVEELKSQVKDLKEALQLWKEVVDLDAVREESLREENKKLTKEKDELQSQNKIWKDCVWDLKERLDKLKGIQH